MQRIVLKKKMALAYLRKYQRYGWALLCLGLFFFLSADFPAEKIVAEDCLTGECQFNLENPSQKELQNITESQVENNYDFFQLKTPDIILGQVFKAESNSIAELELDFDIVRQHNNGGKKYSLVLKEIEQKKWKLSIKSGLLAELRFQIKDLVKYRQQNGKYRFPLVGQLEKGKLYFWGLDNRKMQVDRFNHLVFKGSSNNESYLAGTAAIKQNKETQTVEGDLYFRIFSKD